MVENKSLVFLQIVSLLLISNWAFAHHSDAEFFPEKLITVEATVTELEFVNPHTIIDFQIKNAQGNAEQWKAYGGPPNQMVHEGWTSHTLKPGEVIKITGHPSKYGRKIMNFDGVVRANGEVLRNRSHVLGNVKSALEKP